MLDIRKIYHPPPIKSEGSLEMALSVGPSDRSCIRELLFLIFLKLYKNEDMNMEMRPAKCHDPRVNNRPAPGVTSFHRLTDRSAQHYIVFEVHVYFGA